MKPADFPSPPSTPELPPCSSGAEGGPPSPAHSAGARCRICGVASGAQHKMDCPLDRPLVDADAAGVTAKDVEEMRKC